MPKRKREESVEEKCATFRKELHRALKAAKGFERQRQAKRIRSSKGMPDKIQRLDREVAVLKSLDLHQAAHAHLCASLLKIKAVAESPNLPDEIKSGVPKPDISEEEKVALHNVTSALYSKKEVRGVLEKAIPAICAALGVPVPEKKKGKSKKADSADGRQEQEDQPADRDRHSPTAAPAAKREKPVREPTPESADDDAEEEAISRFEAMLGGSSDEEESSSELDPMEVTTDEEAGELDSMEVTTDEEGAEDGDTEEDEEDEEEEWEGFGSSDAESANSGDDNKFNMDKDITSESSDPDSSSVSASPPPKRTKSHSTTTNQPFTTGSTFLPSLMGGYISGSESSASDIDVAPPRKNRRGQRARQEIWEKKYKQKAKHLAKQNKDAGWDPRRGAVDDSSRKPWKKGIKNPFEKGGGRHEKVGRPAVKPEGANSEPLRARPPQPKPRAKLEDSGPLHPSWEARRKAKERQETATFQGKKITFD